MKRRDIITRLNRARNKGEKPDLSDIDLSTVDLSEVDLSWVHLRGAYLHRTNFHSANLREADLREANLSNANLRNADLTGTYMYKANLTGADLTKANLHAANLSGARLNKANLSGADLRWADLAETNLTEVQTDELTKIDGKWLSLFTVDQQLLKRNLNTASSKNLTTETVQSDEEFAGTIEIRQRQAKKLSVEELKRKTETTDATPNMRNIITKQYERDQYVAELARRRAQGKCQLCSSPAPFNNRDGEPFLEIHHVEWLSKGGEDTLENTVALCPNCHRKMHILDLPEDRVLLRKKAREDVFT